MGEPKFGVNDFDFSFHIDEDLGVATVSHLEVDEDIRNNGYGSVIIETLKRVALQNNNIKKIKVSIGGGKSAEEFLESNGFRIVERREYTTKLDEDEGDFGVDAEYLEEWIPRDY